MNQFAEVVEAFGNQLGVQNLQLNAQGVVQLRMENGVIYALEETEEALLLQLLFPVAAFESLEIKKRLLLLADYRKQPKMPLYILRYSKENIILQLRLLPVQANVQSLGEGMDFLFRCMEYAFARREAV